jgi:hypothetical protein
MGVLTAYSPIAWRVQGLCFVPYGHERWRGNF